MADEFDNPLAQGNLDRLNRQLDDVVDVLQRNLAVGEQAREAAEGARASTERRARREGQTVARRAGLVPPGTRPRTPAEEIATGEQVSRTAERKARAEADAARSIRAQADAVRRGSVAGGAADTVRDAFRRAQAAEVIAAAEQQRAARQSRTDRLSVEEATERVRMSEARMRADRLTAQTFRPQPLALPPGSFTPVGPSTGGGVPYNRGGAPPPPPPPPVAFGLPDREPGDFNRHLGQVAQSEDLSKRAAQADLEWRREMERLSRTIGINGDDLRRHGALTTEFISAAARGQVEIRELGFQVGSTIGKFAGWTAAAGAVFGVVEALSQVKTGAVESLNAVNQMQRIIPDLDQNRAQGDIRRLSREFNMPIPEVGDALYQSSKIFQDYEATVEGTRQALFGMKVGELEAGDATRYLNSIVRAFPGADLADVFDTINHAQNRFGGNLSEIIAGVARAGNAFRNAGGDYASLVALIQTGSLVTGRPALEIATGIQRSAEIILRPERRQRIIDLLGVDPQDTSIEDLYLTAMERVKDMSASEAAEVARALSTPELATGRILPILQNGPRFREQRAEITSGRQKGSSERELERTLKSPTELLKAFGVEMQNLGSALAESGALHTIGLMVQLLTDAVGLTADFVGLVGGIAGPLAPVVMGFAQIAAATALMRRFNVGGLFAEGSAGREILGRNPARMERAEIMQGLGFQRQFLEEEQRQTARRAAVQLRQIDADVARDRRVQLDPDATDDDLLRSQRRVQTSIDRYEDLWSEHANYAGEIERTQAQTNAFQKETSRRNTRNVQQVRDAATRNEIFYRGNIGPLPVPGEAQPVGGAGAPTVVGGIGSASAGQERQARAMQDQAKETSRATAAARRLGVSGRVVGTTATAGAAAAAAAGRAVRATVSGIGALVTSLGPLDVALALAFLNYQTLATAAEQDRQGAAMWANRGKVDDLRRSAEKELQDNSGLDALQGLYADITNAVVGNFVPGMPDLASPDQEQDEQARAAKREAEGLAKARRGGALLLQNQIRDRLKRRLGEAENDAERQRAIDQAQEELARSYGKAFGAPTARDRREIQTTEDDIRRAQADVEAQGRSLAERLDALQSLDDTADFALRTSNRIRMGGFTPRNRSRIRGQVERMRELLQETDDPKEQQELLSQIDSAQQQFVERAQRSLAGVQFMSPGRQRAARQEYLSRLRKLYGGKNATPDDKFAMEEAERETNRAQFEAETAAFDARTQRLGAEEADPLARARTLAQRMRQRTNRVREAVGKGIESQNALEQAIGQEADARRQVIEESIARFESQQELASARFEATLPTDAARLQRGVSDADALVARLRQHGGDVDPGRMNQALTAVARARQALNEYVREQAQEMIRARTELAIANTEDPVRQAELREGEARQLARFARSPADRIRARADIRNAQRERVQTEQREAYDTIEFNASLGRITQDTQIEQLESLLRTVRGNRDLRRQIMQRIHQLRNEANSQQELSLGLDDIRIPTAYEMRRIVAGGAAQVTNNRNVVTVQVSGPQDYDRLGQVLEEHLTGAGAAIRRAAGGRR